MGIIKNRTTLNGELLSLVANGAVGNCTSKKINMPFEKNTEVERAM